MKNEHYFRQELENKMTDFLDKELSDGDFGWLGDNITKLMADAAFAVLMANKDVNDYLEREGHLKN